jgi:hypothetical protein
MAWDRAAQALQIVFKTWHEIIFYVSFAFTLINTFGAGTKWLTRTFRLLAFVLILFVPIMRKLSTYLTSDSIIHQVSYGPNKRNSVDIYLVPKELQGRDLCPVVMYVGGGGWTVGFRMWALLMAKFFTDNGIILLAVDYRNFPQGTVSNMLTDINNAISWTFENISKFGGDPNNIHIMGQSAGAHLVLLGTVDQAARECYVHVREKGLYSPASFGDFKELKHSANSSPIIGNGNGNGNEQKAVVTLRNDTLHPNRTRTQSLPRHPTPQQHDAHVGVEVPPPSSQFLSLTPEHEIKLLVQQGREKKMAMERALTLSNSLPPSTWHLKNIRNVFCLSGPFDINRLVPHLHDRGLYRQVMYCIMEGELSHNSPYARMQKKIIFGKWRVRSAATCLSFPW